MKANKPSVPAFIEILIGEPDDNCPICRAQRAGKSLPEILTEMGAPLPAETEAVAVLVGVPAKGVNRG